MMNTIYDRLRLLSATADEVEAGDPNARNNWPVQDFAEEMDRLLETAPGYNVNFDEEDDDSEKDSPLVYSYDGKEMNFHDCSGEFIIDGEYEEFSPDGPKPWDGNSENMFRITVIPDPDPAVACTVKATRGGKLDMALAKEYWDWLKRPAA